MSGEEDTPPALLGPSCGIDAFDDATRALALDLFVDPAGIQALARYWVAVFIDRPKMPMPAPSFCALLHRFRDVERAAHEGRAPAHFDLALNGYETDGRGLAFILRLFADSSELVVSYDFLLKARRVKTMCALAELLNAQSPPLHAPAATPRAFSRGTLAGLRGEFQVEGFCHNALLAFFFNPVMFAAIGTVEYLRAIVLQPSLVTHAPLIAGLLLPVAHTLVEWGDPLLVDLATLLGQQDVQTPQALYTQARALLTPELVRARALYSLMEETWRVRATKQAAQPPQATQ